MSENAEAKIAVEGKYSLKCVLKAKNRHIPQTAKEDFSLGLKYKNMFSYH